MTVQLSLKGKYFSLYTFCLNVLVAFHSCVRSGIISCISLVHPFRLVIALVKDVFAKSIRFKTFYSVESTRIKFQ